MIYKKTQPKFGLKEIQSHPWMRPFDKTNALVGVDSFMPFVGICFIE
jgi:hypothetical protein